MQITRYTFGKIEIDDKYYDSDIIITPGCVKDHWRRKEGHNLAIEDLADIIATEPEVVIVGTGYFDRMKVPISTREYLQEKGIRVEIASTPDAVRQFNHLQRDCARVVAALHLTC